jgi:parallel beta-helix repeat protein
MAATARPCASHTGLAGVLVTLSVALLLALPDQSRASGTSCALYTARNGSDSAPGTLTQPFESVQHLADALSAGQTGCVRGGAYIEDVTITDAGAPGAPIAITSYRGERATLTGRLWVHKGANYVTVSGMNLNGRNTNNLPSPDINAAYTTFTADDVTNEHTAICVDIGSDTTYGRAENTLIQGNRIHDCGTLPAANHDHGIYVESSTGAQIRENVIYNNADRGIQLYPDAQDTVIEHNIIDANGEGVLFSGDFGVASDNNTVAHNIITNARLRDDLESWYPAGNPTGQGNTAQDNCVWSAANEIIETPATGFAATNNIITNPEYANPATGDYRINSTSPCAAFITNTNTPTQPFNRHHHQAVAVASRIVALDHGKPHDLHQSQ